MDRNLLLNDEPYIGMIEHPNTTCAVEWTNFSARLNPAGMALLKSIDPKARFIQRYYHVFGMNAIVLRAGVVGSLNTVDGFARLCRQVLLEHDTGSFAMIFTVAGFPYEIDVKNDSPLVGWFTVMKERE